MPNQCSASLFVRYQRCCNTHEKCDEYRYEKRGIHYRRNDALCCTANTAGTGLTPLSPLFLPSSTLLSPSPPLTTSQSAMLGPAAPAGGRKRQHEVVTRVCVWDRWRWKNLGCETICFGTKRYKVGIKQTGDKRYTRSNPDHCWYQTCVARRLFPGKREKSFFAEQGDQCQGQQVLQNNSSSTW